MGNLVPIIPVSQMQTVTSTRPPFLVVAVTGRALAASASRGGHQVIVLDYFADRDTCAVASECRRVAAAHRLRFDRRALLAAAQAASMTSRCAGLVYGSGFEGCPGLLARLTRGLRLYGNTPAVVAAVRDPSSFFGLLDRLRIRHPEVRLTVPADRAGWLIKQAGGAGGAHVRPAGRRPVRAGGYYQRLSPGRSLSALFLADGRRACIIGFNEQWTTRARPSLPFRYGGAMSGVELPPAVARDIRRKLDALVAATGLVGLNGLDFLLHLGDWSALEVNPRPTATMELYDPDYPRGLFDWHLRACDGELPAHPVPPRAIRAHAVVYATAAIRMSAAFEPPDWCRDVPHPGASFAPGEPVCTVHAAAAAAERASALLRRRQTQLERLLHEAAA
jgi:predicted ATP-grasp superfamily ATP-dependent carboligase